MWNWLIMQTATSSFQTLYSSSFLNRFIVRFLICSTCLFFLFLYKIIVTVNMHQNNKPIVYETYFAMNLILIATLNRSLILSSQRCVCKCVWMGPCLKPCRLLLRWDGTQATAPEITCHSKSAVRPESVSRRSEESWWNWSYSSWATASDCSSW